MKAEIIAKEGTLCHVRAFEGHPLAKCRLLDKVYLEGTGWRLVVMPLETAFGYTKGKRDTCREVIPCKAKRWIQKGLKFSPKPYAVDFDSLPILTNQRG